MLMLTLMLMRCFHIIIDLLIFTSIPSPFFGIWSQRASLI